ncbi:MAG: hypothetical protein AAF236_06280 [Verrucomicrobiota bacterium]
MNDNDREDSAVWELLKEARSVEPSPFFARNVLREIRLQSERREGIVSRIFDYLATRKLVVAGVGLALVVSAIVLTQFDSSGDPALASSPVLAEDALAPILESPTAQTFDPASEMVAVGYLGELMAVADPGMLSDEALGDLFF